MKPYYECEQGRLYKGDCLEIMPLLEGQFDLVLTDPPYNISKQTNFNQGTQARSGMDFGAWDKDFNLTSWIPCAVKSLSFSGSIVVFNDWKNLGEINLTLTECGVSVKRCLVLQKNNLAPFNANRLYLNTCEFALWGTMGKGWVFNVDNKLHKGIFYANVQNKDLHPTMKDLEVIKQLILIHSNETDLILDPFAGSGTTAIACIRTNRKFVIIEKEEKYCEIIIQRIKDEISQGKLF
ncbi:MAG: site-specific DNA-methyltransferase [Patescibacteria group bacterium]